MLLWAKYTYLTGQRPQNTCQRLSTDQCLEVVVIVDKVLGAHQLALAFDIYFVIWHPFALLAWPRFHFFRPLCQLNWVDKLVFVDSQKEEAVAVVGFHL